MNDNNTLRYIQQEYKDYLINHVFLNKDNFNILKKGHLIKGINKKNLKLEIISKLCFFNHYYKFIRTFDPVNKKFMTIYINDYFIFFKKKENRNDIFKLKLDRFIKNIEKK